MTALSPPASFSPAHLRELVQEILSAGSLPPVVQAGHPALRQHAAAFDGQISAAELQQLVALMRRVMHEAPGVGLAAPQLGIPLQLAVLEDQYDVDPETAGVRHRTPLEFLAIINPRYAAVGTETAAFFEGCLSLSGLQAVVARHESVLLRFDTPEGLSSEQEFHGWQARIVQHETDHVHGILYVDRAELRSLSCNAEYAANWAEPGIEKARAALGFLPDNP